jgi:hypothetical protein
VSYGWGGYHSCRKQQQTLHISANAILSYVRSHPSGGSVPWDVWGPGNVRVVPRRSVAYETVTGMHTLCGMRALSDHIVKDRHSRPVICVYDYHRGRVGKALSTKRPELPHPVAMSYVLPGGENEMPCLVKEIPIPRGLLVGNLMCVLCEHAVVLLEVSELYFFYVALADYCPAVGQEIGCSDKWSVLSCNMSVSIVLDCCVYSHTMASFVTSSARIASHDNCVIGSLRP